ncbi:ATP phosphoribosyltransferase [Paenibacillus medicaginis]|uniref:ATP phosphoribosyltransferase n=1 Tax=Paenibacillus medicaginis TaxID=1470560 RepID=A0ABV5C5L2_9BACL
MIKIGLPKGVVKHKSISVIETFLNYDINKEKLHFFDNSRVHFYLLKHRDIPKLISSGNLDFGITSTEWIYESDIELHVHKELDWCDTRISLISGKGEPVLGQKLPIRCVTEFPRIANDFFKKINQTDVVIDSISGSSEALIPSLYNCCVDCVETGYTLALHNLAEEKVIYESKVVLVSKNEISDKVKKLVDEVLEVEASDKICFTNRM